MWLEQSKGVREEGKKDRKFSSTCRTRTHDLLNSGQAHTTTVPSGRLQVVVDSNPCVGEQREGHYLSG